MTAQTQTLLRPAIGESPSRLVLYKHRVVAHSDLSSILPATFDALYRHIGQAGIRPAGPPFVAYHDDSEPGVRWSVDIGAPVSAPISATPEFEFMDIPAGRVVSLLHVGPYEELGKVYAAIQRFIAENSLTPTGPPREVYLSEPDTPPAQTRTLVEFPIA